MVSFFLLSFSGKLHSLLSLHLRSCKTWPFCNKLSNTYGNYSIWKRQYFLPQCIITRHGLERALAFSSIYSYFIKSSGRASEDEKHSTQLDLGVQRCRDLQQKSRDARREGFPLLVLDALPRRCLLLKAALWIFVNSQPQSARSHVKHFLISTPSEEIKNNNCSTYFLLKRRCRECCQTL